MPASAVQRSWWVVGILGAVVLVVAAWARSKGVPVKTDILAKTTDLLTSLFVITVFVERSLAVINDIWLGEEREKREREVARVQGRLNVARADIERAQAVRAAIAERSPAAPQPDAGQPQVVIAGQVETEMQTLQAEVTQLDGNLAAAAEAVTTIEGKQDRLRLQLGFLFSLSISAVGVRTLAALLDIDAVSLSREQMAAFEAVDILLTAGLIAGGSTGINSIADLLGTYVEASRKRAQR